MRTVTGCGLEGAALNGAPEHRAPIRAVRSGRAGRARRNRFMVPPIRHARGRFRRVKPFVSVEDANFDGKRVLVRVDFNVPLDGGRVRDETRLRASFPTIRKLLADGARVILCSHLGRPGGRVDPAASLRPVARRLEELLSQPVAFAQDCVGPAAEEAVAKLRPGDALLLENVRFHKAEEENNPEFAQQLAALADAYVNDAFGSAHRAHASTEGVAHLLPAYAGLLMRRELEALGGALDRPERPFVAVIGGAKVSGKIDVLRHLLARVDAFCIGGAMAFTFSLALGGRVGESLVERDRVVVAEQFLREAKERQVDVVLPSDVVVAEDLKGDGPTRLVPFGEVPEGWKGADIGPKSVERFGERIVGAKTVLVNGPMGVFEVDRFLEGTRGVFEAAASAAGTTIVGGGDSAAALARCGLTDRVTHVSTGGGASLEFLEGKTLPGVAVLLRYARTHAR